MTDTERINTWWTCRACGNRQRVRTHPDDRAGTIRVGCPDCGEETEHTLGGFG